MAQPEVQVVSDSASYAKFVPAPLVKERHSAHEPQALIFGIQASPRGRVNGRSNIGGTFHLPVIFAAWTPECS